MRTKWNGGERAAQPGSRASRRKVGWDNRLAILTLVTLTGGCEVINPGPVDDVLVNLPTAHLSLVNGAGRELSVAVSQIGYTGAIASRELMPGGQTGAGGHDPIVQAGRMLSNNIGTAHWNSAQRSRWIAENAIARFTQELDPGTVAPETLTQAYLWAGYANRILGENMCQAVFNGGPAEPYIRYLERAEQHFTNALSAGGSAQQGVAARAGRASVRVGLRDWTGAVTDAAQVPLAFQYLVATEANDPDALNDIYYSNAGSPYRGYTIWMTFFEDYYTQTGDPRVSWGRDPARPLADQQLSGYGAVPWSFSRKYRSNGDPFRLSTGREMVLIRAEALLESGNWNDAMVLINSLRTAVASDVNNQPLAGWNATSLQEAWAFLKRERSIEFWLEARRLGDLRRWEANGTPGSIDWPNFESISPLFVDNPPSRCFPIPQAELDANPNLTS